MNDETTWKILFFVCGDASDRLAPGQGGIDLDPLLAPDGCRPAPATPSCWCRRSLAANQPALRLVQLAGRGVGIASGNGGLRPPTALQRAMTSSAGPCAPTPPATPCSSCTIASPTRQTHSLAGGSVFSVVGPADAPDFWPLTEAGLGEMADQFATRGLGSWLASLVSSLTGRLTALRPRTSAAAACHPQGDPTDATTNANGRFCSTWPATTAPRFKSKYGKYSLMAEMTSAGIKTSDRGREVGTTDQVAVLAQFDTLPSKDPLAKDWAPRRRHLPAGDPQGPTASGEHRRDDARNQHRRPSRAGQVHRLGHEPLPGQAHHAGAVEPRPGLEGRRHLPEGARACRARSVRSAS